MCIIIRPAHPDDSAAIARVHVDSWRSTYRGIMPDAVLDHLSYDQRQAMWESILRADQTTAAPSIVFVAATSDGSIVGFASGGLERSGDPTYTGELYAIYLMQTYQERGLGCALMQQVCQKLAERGVQNLLVWVVAHNPACFFYEKMGGHRIHQRQDLSEGVVLDEIAYGWPTVTTVIEKGDQRRTCTDG